MSDLDHESLLRLQREQAIKDMLDASRDDGPPAGSKMLHRAKLNQALAAGAGRKPSFWRMVEGRPVYLVGLALILGAGVAVVSARTDGSTRADGSTRTYGTNAASSPASEVVALEAPPEMDGPSRSAGEALAPFEARGATAPAPVVVSPDTASIVAASAEPAPVVAMPLANRAKSPPPSIRPARSSADPEPTAASANARRAMAASSSTDPSSSPGSSNLDSSNSGASVNPSPSQARAESTLGQEVARITAARSALAAGEASRTLEILDSYESEFPKGAFPVEVSVLRVEALARSGRMDEARLLGRRFLERHPHGLFANRVASALGIVLDPGQMPLR